MTLFLEREISIPRNTRVDEAHVQGNAYNYGLSPSPKVKAGYHWSSYNFLVDNRARMTRVYMRISIHRSLFQFLVGEVRKQGKQFPISSVNPVLFQNLCLGRDIRPTSLKSRSSARRNVSIEENNKLIFDCA